MAPLIPVQLNTDTHVQGDARLAEWTQQELSQRLERFGELLTRVEVHFSDENGARGGGTDKRCLLEARLAGRQPVAVRHEAGTVAEAFLGACDKLHRVLDGEMGRARDAQRRAPASRMDR